MEKTNTKNASYSDLFMHIEIVTHIPITKIGILEKAIIKELFPINDIAIKADNSPRNIYF